jgi:hypothetical protein
MPQRNAVFMDSQLFPEEMRSESPAPDSIAQTWYKAEDDKSSPDGTYKSVALGDQGYFWALMDNHPELFKPLPLHWEVSNHTWT